MGMWSILLGGLTEEEARRIADLVPQVTAVPSPADAEVSSLPQLRQSVEALRGAVSDLERCNRKRRREEEEASRRRRAEKEDEVEEERIVKMVMDELNIDLDSQLVDTPGARKDVKIEAKDSELKARMDNL